MKYIKSIFIFSLITSATSHLLGSEPKATRLYARNDDKKKRVATVYYRPQGLQEEVDVDVLPDTLETIGEFAEINPTSKLIVTVESTTSTGKIASLTGETDLDTIKTEWLKLNPDVEQEPILVISATDNDKLSLTYDMLPKKKKIKKISPFPHLPFVFKDDSLRLLIKSGKLNKKGIMKMELADVVYEPTALGQAYAWTKGFLWETAEPKKITGEDLFKLILDNLQDGYTRGDVEKAHNTLYTEWNKFYDSPQMTRLAADMRAILNRARVKLEEALNRRTAQRAH